MSLQHNASVDWDSVHRSNYEAAAFNVSGWLSKARSLYVSAKALEPEVNRVPPANLHELTM